MGIDAEMIVRHKGAPLTEKQIRQLASRLAAVVGHDKFFIQRPDPSSTWHPEGCHALSLVPTIAEVKAEYGSDYAEWIGPHVQGAPEDRQLYTQDGDPIVADEGEQMLRVHLWTRYYGEGYERGDWPTIRATAEFLEAALPGAEVWYGGDSSGVCAEPLTARRREELNRHFLTQGHEPYRSAFGSYDGQPAQTCEFCGDRPMHNVGGGQGDTFWSCDGCGLKRVTSAKGSYDLPEKVDFFDCPREG